LIEDVILKLLDEVFPKLFDEFGLLFTSIFELIVDLSSLVLLLLLLLLLNISEVELIETGPSDDIVSEPVFKFDKLFVGILLDELEPSLLLSDVFKLLLDEVELSIDKVLTDFLFSFFSSCDEFDKLEATLPTPSTDPPRPDDISLKSCKVDSELKILIRLMVVCCVMLIAVGRPITLAQGLLLP
jgi:hypothetical protein